VGLARRREPLRAARGERGTAASRVSGPLAGVRVLELAGIGPGPFAGMLLADMGAEVSRVERPAGASPFPGVDPRLDVLRRGRRFVTADLKTPEGLERVRALADAADVLIDPFRPGTTERLGLGPDELCARNPRLIYGRITGWGQTGPWAHAAGHDLNYIALAGALGAMGRRDSPPPPPLNLVADFGGGGMLLAFGVAAALVERERSGRGQVVDAAMVDGVALQLAMLLSFRAMGGWSDERESNALDGGAPWYDSYATADGKHVAVGAIEPQFYADLLARLGLDPAEWPQHDRRCWPRLRAALARTFAARTRDEWAEALAGTDACVTPVLSVEEAAAHPQNAARGVYRTVDGVLQPAPAPRFSRSDTG
jgi:alpha-methylacyl-CoA racemase